MRLQTLVQYVANVLTAIVGGWMIWARRTSTGIVEGHITKTLWTLIDMLARLLAVYIVAHCTLFTFMFVSLSVARNFKPEITASTASDYARGIDQIRALTAQGIVTSFGAAAFLAMVSVLVWLIRHAVNGVRRGVRRALA